MQPGTHCARSTRIQQIMESLFTAAQYQLVSMALNSLGVQLDPGLEDRLPKDVRLPALAARPTTPRLKQPRMQAAERSADDPTNSASSSNRRRQRLDRCRICTRRSRIIRRCTAPRVQLRQLPATRLAAAAEDARAADHAHRLAHPRANTNGPITSKPAQKRRLLRRGDPAHRKRPDAPAGARNTPPCCVPQTSCVAKPS